MKSTINILIIFLLMFFSVDYGQDMSLMEFDQVIGSTTGYTYGDGGIRLPSIGSLHILIVFAEFPDDNYDIYNSRWTKGNAPQNMSDWIDGTWSTNPTQGSFTHYFNEMSLNRFMVTGETIHKIAPRTRWEYDHMIPKYTRGEIQKEILQEIDITKDFSAFDNWETSADYTHSNVSDQEVDMIIFIWRNAVHDSSKYASNLDFGSSYGDLGRFGSFDIDGTARRINTNTFGSGVTVRSYYELDPFKAAIHEFAHYLFGINDMHNGYGFWGMLADWGTRSYVANAWERYQLGWINNPTTYTIDADITTDLTLNRTLGDFVTTGNAYRIIIDAANNEYFYVENHQKTSYWENHAPFSDHPNSIEGEVENGIYVIRQEGMANTSAQFSKVLVPADGRFSWDVNQSIQNPYKAAVEYLPVYEKTGIDKINGYHTLERVPHSYIGCQNPYMIYFTEDQSGNPVETPEFLGDGYDAFRMDYNQVFSPWSNPNNQLEDHSTTNFGFNLTGLSSGTYSMTFYINNADDAPPSKPQNFRKAFLSTEHPSIEWDANTEPDLNGYKIYRQYNGGSWLLRGTVSSTTTSYIDNSIVFDKPIDEVDVNYKIKAFDTSNNLSVFSNIVYSEGRYDEDPIILGDNTESANTALEKEESEFNLSSYPNPFNPVTNINFSITEDLQVKVKVYSSLGEEVGVLADNFYSKGNYSVMFNGAELPSGIYFVTMQAGNKIKTHKLLLLK